MLHFHCTTYTEPFATVSPVLTKTATPRPRTAPSCTWQNVKTKHLVLNRKATGEKQFFYFIRKLFSFSNMALEAIEIEFHRTLKIL